MVSLAPPGPNTATSGTGLFGYSAALAGVMPTAREGGEWAAMSGDRAGAASDEAAGQLFTELRNSWIRVAHNHPRAGYRGANGPRRAAGTPMDTRPKDPAPSRA